MERAPSAVTESRLAQLPRSSIPGRPAPASELARHEKEERQLLLHVLGEAADAHEDASAEKAVTVRTQLSVPVSSGSTTMPVADIRGFSAGMPITISDGSNSETRTTVGVTSQQPQNAESCLPAEGVLTIDTPLEQPHAAGTTVIETPHEAVTVTTQLTDSVSSGSTSILVADVRGIAEGRGIMISDGLNSEKRTAVCITSHQQPPTDSCLPVAGLVMRPSDEAEATSCVNVDKLEEELLEVRARLKQMQADKEEFEHCAVRAEDLVAQLMEQLKPGCSVTAAQIRQQLKNGLSASEILQHVRRGSPPLERPQQESGSNSEEVVKLKKDSGNNSEEVVKLEKDSGINSEEVVKLKKENKRLRLMLEELRAKLADLMEECKKQGLEATVAKIADVVGLSKVLQIHCVFERLYQDAMDRIGRLEALRQRYRASRDDLIAAGIAPVCSLPTDIIDIVSQSNLIFQLREPMRLAGQKEHRKKRSERGHIANEDSCRVVTKAREANLELSEDSWQSPAAIRLSDGPPLRYLPGSPMVGDDKLRYPLNPPSIPRAQPPSPEACARSSSLPSLHQNRRCGEGLIIVGGLMAVKDDGWR